MRVWYPIPFLRALARTRANTVGLIRMCTCLYKSPGFLNGCPRRTGGSLPNVLTYAWWNLACSADVTRRADLISNGGFSLSWVVFIIISPFLRACSSNADEPHDIIIVARRKHHKQNPVCGKSNQLIPVFIFRMNGVELNKSVWIVASFRTFFESGLTAAFVELSFEWIPRESHNRVYTTNNWASRRT
jgi:hypothetical protein